VPVTEIDDTEFLQLAAELRDALPPLDEEEQRIAVSLYRLLAEGNPVGEAPIARAAAVPAEQVSRALAEWPGVFRNDAGDVVGFWGLTVIEMPPHSFYVGSAHLWTWCAWDTLFIPVVIARPARVESVCSTTGQRIVVTVGPGGVVDVSPPEAVISFLRPQERFDKDVILNFCHHVLFFSSPKAGETWIRERDGAMLLSLEQGFALGASVVDEKYAAGLHSVKGVQ